MISTVIAAIATKNARIRMLTRYVSRNDGATTTTPTISRAAAASDSTGEKPPMIGVASAGLACCMSGTRKALRPDAKHDGGKDGDGQSTKDRIDEGRDDHLASAEHETGNRKRKQRSAGHHHQHEGADQPRQAHIRIDARQRRNQRAGQCGKAA